MVVVVDCYTALGGTVAVEDLESSVVEAGESLGAFAVEACHAYCTHTADKP